MGVRGMRENAIKFASVFIALLMCVTVIGEIKANASPNEASKSPDCKNVNAGYWAPVEKAMSVNGSISSDGTMKFGIPMNQEITLDGIQLNPGSDRTHEFDFMRAGNKAMMVGEIGLTETEVKNVSRMVVRSGLQVTALHNHLLRTSPHIMWLHIYGYGDPVDIANKIRNITDSINGNSPAVNETARFQSKGVNTTRLDRIIGYKGSVEGGDYSYSIPRADKIWMNGYELSPGMDVSTDISFQPLGNGRAAVLGEFALETDEVEPVIRTLTEDGIEVTALHSHMLTEQPRLFYVHCWAAGNATELASGIREALNETNSTAGSQDES
jgi:hypothetical protein